MFAYKRLNIYRTSGTELLKKHNSRPDHPPILNLIMRKHFISSVFQKALVISSKGCNKETYAAIGKKIYKDDVCVTMKRWKLEFLRFDAKFLEVEVVFLNNFCASLPLYWLETNISNFFIEMENKNISKSVESKFGPACV